MMKLLFSYNCAVIPFQDMADGKWFVFTPETISFHLEWRGKADKVTRGDFDGEVFCKRGSDTFMRIRDGASFTSLFTQHYKVKPVTEAFVRSD